TEDIGELPEGRGGCGLGARPRPLDDRVSQGSRGLSRDERSVLGILLRGTPSGSGDGPGRSPPRHEGRGPGHRLHPGGRKASIPAAHPGVDGQEEEIEEGREEESLLRGPQGKEGEEVARGYRRGIVRRSS